MGIFIWLGIRLDLGIWYYAGIASASAMLIYENSIVRPNDLSRLNLAFFTLNSLVSMVLFFFVAVDVIYGRGGLG
jgi:4-hydroxybenzoate polyprenyltransferase